MFWKVAPNPIKGLSRESQNILTKKIITTFIMIQSISKRFWQI